MSDTVLGTSIGIDALFQYTSSGVQVFSGMVFYVIIAHIFNTTAVGAIALFVAIIGLFNSIFSFGLGSAAQHFTSYSLGLRDYPSVRSTIVRVVLLGFVLSIASFITLIIISPWLSILFLHTFKYTLLIRLLSVVLFGYVLFGILNGTLLGMQGFRISAVINIAIWISYYFMALFLTLLAHSLVVVIIGWMGGIFIGVFVEILVIFRTIKNYAGDGKPPSNNLLIKYSIPILFSGLISYSAVYADRFIVAGLLTLNQLAVYNFSLLMVSAVTFIVVPFNNIIMPKFSELYGKGSRATIAKHVRATGIMLSSLYVPTSLTIAALSPFLLEMFGGTAYVSGQLSLTIIMIFSSLFIIQNVFAQAIASVRKTHLLVISSSIALTCNLLISIALVPSLGLTGAALGFSAVYASLFAVLSFMSLKEKLLSIDLVGLAKIWGSSLFLFAVLKMFMSFNSEDPLLILAYIILAIILYLLIMRALRTFSNEDKMLILSFFPEGDNLVKSIISFIL